MNFHHFFNYHTTPLILKRDNVSHSVKQDRENNEQSNQAAKESNYQMNSNFIQL